MCRSKSKCGRETNLRWGLTRLLPSSRSAGNNGARPRYHLACAQDCRAIDPFPTIASVRFPGGTVELRWKMKPRLHRLDWGSLQIGSRAQSTLSDSKSKSWRSSARASHCNAATFFPIGRIPRYVVGPVGPHDCLEFSFHVRHRSGVPVNGIPAPNRSAGHHRRAASRVTHKPSAPSQSARRQQCALHKRLRACEPGDMTFASSKTVSASLQRRASIKTSASTGASAPSGGPG